jgi:uncharacterized protein (TIGR03435 family)
MRHVSCKIVFLVTAITATVMPVASQRSPAQKPSFEVATVKPANGGRSFLNVPPGSGYFEASGFPLKWFVCHAYRLRYDQVLGEPAWVNTDLWEIHAKAADGTVPQPSPTADNTKPDAIALMLQSLLEERFQLQLHRDTREFPVYILAVANGGSKLKLSEDQGGSNDAPPQNISPDQPRGMIRRTGDDMTARGVRMSFLATFLSQWLGRPVLDKTGLDGLFDFSLHWTPPRFAGTPPGFPGPDGREVSPPPAIDPSGVSIFTAIQELGLKLEPAKEPLEVLVIDSVQKPHGN